jgi:hypothetical protein
VAILRNLEGCDVHRVELAVPAILETNVIVRRHVEAIGLWDASALVLEADNLGNGPVAPLDGIYPRGLYLVLGITIPNPRGSTVRLLEWL